MGSCDKSRVILRLKIMQPKSLNLSVTVIGAQLCAPALSLARIRLLIKAALPQGGEVVARFVDDVQMKKINYQYRGKNQTTDVLSFAYHHPEQSVLGDVVICPQAAVTAGRDLSRRLSHLIIHAVLHLSGMRHDTRLQAARMEAMECALLAQFDIPNPY